MERNTAILRQGRLRSVLIWFCGYPVIESLLDRGVEVGASDHLGQTALMMAVRDPRVVDLLLRCAATVSATDLLRKAGATVDGPDSIGGGVR